MHGRLASLAFLLVSSLSACGGATVASSAPTDGGASEAGDGATPLPVCGSGQLFCRGGCTDPSSDPFNCGSCAYACLAGAQCVHGSCVSPPPPDAGAEAGDAAVTVPPDPGGPGPDGGAPAALAFSKLYFGDATRSGQQDPEAWRRYGLNIDGKVTSRASTDVCTLASGAAISNQEDGNGGIDNSFGANVLPILLSTAGDVATSSNAAITKGAATSLVTIDQIGPGPSYSPLAVSLYEATATASPPRWDGTDVRDLDSMSVSSSFPGAVLASPASYMSQRTLVTAPPTGAGTVALGLALGPAGAPPMPITHVQIVATVAPDGQRASGVISGVLPTSALVAWMKQVAGAISSSLCTGAAFQSLATAIMQASDIMTDGTNSPGEACNGISLGMGFDAIAVKQGSIVSTAPAPNPCP